MCAGEALQKDTQYRLTFEVTNPSGYQESPDVSIQASNGVVVPVAQMNRDPAPLVGVEFGSSPLRIEVPTFVTRVVSQVTPLASASNQVLVELIPNVDMDEVTVTVSGLLDATPCESPVAITMVQDQGALQKSVDNSQSVWAEADGVLKFVVFPSPLAYGMLGAEVHGCSGVRAFFSVGAPPDTRPTLTPRPWLQVSGLVSTSGHFFSFNVRNPPASTRAEIVAVAITVAASGTNGEAHNYESRLTT